MQARVAVHSCDPTQVGQLVDQGVAIALRANQAGVVALRERSVRRLGLLVSLGFIVMTMTTLWLLVRRLEARPTDAAVTTEGRL